jgi:hypothetical protein
MKKTLFACALFVLVCPGAWSGVVIEMEVHDPGAASGEPTQKIYAQGEMLRVDSGAGRSGSMSIVFRDDTLFLVSHDKKSCQTIDKQGMEQLGTTVDAAMKQMEAELSKLPPEQRAMMEKMMKGKIPAGMSGVGGPSKPRRVEVGATEKIGEYSCTLHTLYSGDEKVWEVCAATEGLLDDASEALGAFRAMSRFAEQLQESIQQGPFSEMVKAPLYDMDEVGGFPVRMRTFDGGRIASESTLKSIVSKDLDAAVFAVPDDYKVSSLADELKRDR